MDDAKMKESMGYSGGGKSGGAHGPGGIHAAKKRNPNKHAAVNDTPGGPYPHSLGYSDDGGIQGGAAVKHRGATYSFK